MKVRSFLWFIIKLVLVLGILWFLLGVLFLGISAAGEREAYPIHPITGDRVWSAPGYTQKGSNLYPTLPGTSIRDYSASGFKKQGGVWYPTLPGTGIRDYSQGGWKWKQ